MMKSSMAISPQQKFSLWTVLQKDDTPRKDAHAYWICQCECGNIKSVRSTSLRSGKSTSCGCDKGYLFSTEGSNKKIDITNKKFGLITALYPTEKRSGNHIVWHCKCDCGQEFDTDGHSLRAGLTKSCGCLNQSHGEYEIEQLLIQYNIPYEKEKTFETCRFEDSNWKAKFDFFVNNEYLIEFDGKQHFIPGNGQFNSEQQVQLTKKRDIYKNDWCKKNGIPLIRIPYTHLKQLVINDLKLEYSNFII